MHLLLAPLFSTLLAMSSPASNSSVNPNDEQIRILPVAKTPEPETVVLAIALPEAGQTVGRNPVWVQFRIDGYALGAASSFDRADEVSVSDLGQTVHVVVDDRPYFPVNEPAIDPFNEDGYFYDMSFKFELPFRLSEGLHTLRVFPARSFGESLKGDKTFHAINFYIGSDGGKEVDLSRPFLTYNEPSDQLYLTASKPVLLDFCLTNCILSNDGYKVRLTVDGKIKRTLTSWQPYYIYGLTRGKHSIRLELLDGSNKLVPGPFNDVQRTIQLH